MDNKTDTLFRQKTFQSLILGGNDVKKRLNAMKGSAQKVNDTLLYERALRKDHVSVDPAINARTNSFFL